jgi:hypothetical protein
MAKTYIGMILAGTIAATSFAAGGHAPKANSFSNLEMKLQAAADISNAKAGSASSVRTHSLVGNLALSAGAATANVALQTDEGLMVEDAAITGRIGRATVTASYSVGTTDFGSSRNAARNAHFFDSNRLASNIDYGDGALTRTFTLGALQRDSLGVATKVGPANVGVELGKTATVFTAGTAADYNALNAAMSLHGANLGLTVAQIKEDSNKVNEVSLTASAKVAGFDLQAVVTQDKPKSSFTTTTLEKATFAGVKASYKFGAFTLDATAQKGKNTIPGADTEAKFNGIAASTTVGKVSYGIGFSQATSTTDVKTKTTLARVSYSG